MNLPSTVFHIEVAKAGESYVVQWTIANSPLAGTLGSPPLQGLVVFKSHEEMRAWLANTAIKLP